MRFFWIFGLLYLCMGCQGLDAQQEHVDRTPQIWPDYTDIIVPTNIAPLNFHVLEDGEDFLVEYKYKDKVVLRKKTDTKNAIFPQKKWNRILSDYKGDTLYIHISTLDKNKPIRHYKAFWQIVSSDSIDGYLSYRPINPVGGHFHSLEITERQLSSFITHTLFHNSLADGACINCHTYNANNPDIMMFHVRNKHAGTILVHDNQVKKVNLALPDGRNGIFPAWHPNGTIIAFSTNQMYAHQEKGVLRTQMYSFDTDADIFLYDIKNNLIFSDTSLMAKHSQRTYPTWSRDGRYLYYCETTSPDCDFSIPDNNCVCQIRYQLFRIPFNEADLSFGQPELVISSKDIDGGSISFPLFSPDGTYLLFCTTEFGTLDPGQTNSDLWLYELPTNVIRRMDEINSEYVESYHSWSSGSRWFVFSSRRMDGVFARPFFSYLDTSGRASKPFILPQKDPLFYSRYPYAFNIPELSKSKVKVSPYKFSEIIQNEALQPEYKLPLNYKNISNPHSSDIH